MDRTPLAHEDNVQGQLNAGISAATTSIPLKSGEGASFPTTYGGAATSVGDGENLNSTGIGASGIASGDLIENVTDGSVAVVLTVSTNAITTTALRGGSDNTWEDADEWAVNRFVITLIQYDTDGSTILKREKVLIDSRSTDTLIVNASGRGYDGSVAQTFSADDYVYQFWTSASADGINSMLSQMLIDIQSNLDDINFLDSNKADDSAVIKKDGSVAFTGDQSMGSNNLTDVADPVDPQDAATRAWVLSNVVFNFSVFGDGYDGDVTIPAGTTTLTRDMYYDDLTIETGGVLNPSGFRIFVKGTVNCEGTGKIASNGNPGGTGQAGNTTSTNTTGGVGGSVPYSSGTLPIVGAGLAGASGTASPGNSANGTDIDYALIDESGAKGGAGGVGGSGGPGGNSVGGTPGGNTGISASAPRSIVSAYAMNQIINGVLIPSELSGQSTGGGAGGRYTGSSASRGGAGGGSGSTGGIVWLFARNINVLNVEAIGGDGGVGGAGNGDASTGSGSGGGGAGGNGGLIVILYGTVVTLNTDISGGLGGAGGVGGANSGMPGENGKDGEVVDLSS